LEKIPCAYCGRQNQVDAVFCYECGTELRPKPAKRKDSWTLSTAPTPLHWLLGRQRSLKPLIWIAAGVSFAELLFYGVLGRVAALGFFIPSLVPVFNLAEAVVQGTLLAWAASRFLVQARQTGELELLMTTPLGANTLVTTQWEMLKRQARAPVLLAIVLYGISAFSSAFVPGTFWRLPYVLSAVLHAVNTLLGVAAVFWLALLFGLRLTRQSQVIFWTVLLAKGLPYSAGMAWSIFFRS
jgi:ribosomal protein L40E